MHVDVPTSNAVNAKCCCRSCHTTGTKDTKTCAAGEKISTLDKTKVCASICISRSHLTRAQSPFTVILTHVSFYCVHDYYESTPSAGTHVQCVRRGYLPGRCGPYRRVVQGFLSLHVLEAESVQEFRGVQQWWCVFALKGVHLYVCTASTDPDKVHDRQPRL